MNVAEPPEPRDPFWRLVFLRDAWRYGVRVAWRNLRFRVGYSIGGFSYAGRGNPHADRDE